jgi:hypothetical protein
MTRQKSPNRKLTPTTTTDLRTGDSDRLRAEIGVLVAEIMERADKDPRKAAVIIGEWLDRPVSKPNPTKKVA